MYTCILIAQCLTLKSLSFDDMKYHMGQPTPLFCLNTQSPVRAIYPTLLHDLHILEYKPVVIMIRDVAWYQISDLLRPIKSARYPIASIILRKAPGDIVDVQEF